MLKRHENCSFIMTRAQTYANKRQAWIIQEKKWLEHFDSCVRVRVQWAVYYECMSEYTWKSICTARSDVCCFFIIRSLRILSTNWLLHDTVCCTLEPNAVCSAPREFHFILQLRSHCSTLLACLLACVERSEIRSILNYIPLQLLENFPKSF